MRRYRHILRNSPRSFRRDCRGLAAVEFAFILPLMLVLFFAMVETTNGVAIDRKVTLTARTLSDIVSQAMSVTDLDIANSFLASSAILQPYSSGPVQAVISAVKIDADKNATVVWSKGWSEGAVVAGRTPGPVVLPPAFLIENTYLIWGEVSYLYRPSVPYLIKSGITLSDQSFSRPRQSDCVLYQQTKCP